MSKLHLLLFLSFAVLFLPACKKPVMEIPDFQKIGNLTEDLNESSGLLFWEGSIWTHNDSGNSPHLFNISPTDGSLIKTVFVKGVTNVDWEDLAQDDQYFYLGDFGNNDGDRIDLKIHRIEKSQLHLDSVSATTLFFHYPDQDDFNTRPKANNFDCEAMIATSNELILFSKNHINKQTKEYRLPKTPGTYEATLATNFASEGLITGASIDQNTGMLCLLAYNKPDQYEPFVWLFYDYPGNDFFKGKQKKIALDIERKTEGICFWEQDQFYISCEGRSKGEEALYLLDVAE